MDIDFICGIAVTGNKLAFSSSFGRLRVETQTKDSVTLSWSSGRYQLRVWHSPFRLEILCEQELMVTFNSKDNLWFERLQHPPR